MDAACVSKAHSAKNKTAASAEKIFIARKLPARGGGFKGKWTGLLRVVSQANGAQSCKCHN